MKVQRRLMQARFIENNKIFPKKKVGYFSNRAHTLKIAVLLVRTHAKRRIGREIESWLKIRIRYTKGLMKSFISWQKLKNTKQSIVTLNFEIC